MKTITLIIIAVLIATACGNKTQKNNALGKEETSFIKENIVEQRLRNEYKSTQLAYLNDIDCLGIGVVNPKDFKFHIILDTANANKNIYIENIETQELLVPLLWKPDYQIFYMPVVGSTDKFFEVKANKTTSVFVDKREVDFYTWDDLLRNKALSIDVKKGYAEKNIHSEVLFDSDKISLDEISLIVEKVEDDWTFVRKESNELVIDRFWVQWKSKNKLLIKPIFLM